MRYPDSAKATRQAKDSRRPHLQAWVVAAVVGGSLLLALQPLWRGHVPWHGDGLLHFYRLAQLQRALRAGLIYPRWLPDLGYGYGFPLFNYYAPLSYYLLLGPRLMGLSLAASLQFGFGLAVITLGIGAYLWARTLWGRGGAITAVLAIVYAPYLLYNVYHRAALAELWGLAWLLLTLWAVSRLSQTITGSGRQQKAFFLIAVLTYAALILSHNITALVGTPLVLGYGLFTFWYQRHGHFRARRLLWPAAFLILGLGLSAFFWLPALGETGYVQIEQLYASANFDYRNNFLSLNELLALPQTADPAQVNPDIPRALGWPQMVLALLAWLPSSYSLSRSQKAHRLALTLATLGLTLMALPLSRPLWGALPLLRFVQFPWRFLGPASLGLGLLAGLGGRQLMQFCLGHSRVTMSTYVAKLLKCFAPVVQKQCKDSWSKTPGSLISSRQKRRRQRLPIALDLVFILLPLSAILLLALPFLFPGPAPTLPHDMTPAETIRFEAETGWLGTTAAADYLPRAVHELPPPDSLLSRYQAQPGNDVIPRLDESQLPGSAAVLQARYGLTEARLSLNSPDTFRAEFDWFYFPGWQARLDGKPHPLAASQPHGLITTVVPAGTHTLHLQFGSTPLRRVASIVSLVSLAAVIVVLLVVPTRNGRASSHSQPEPATAISLRQEKTLYLSAVVLVLVLFSIKTVYLDDANTIFRQTAFDGEQVQGVELPLHVNFGDELMLLGADLPSSVPADGVLDITLYWQALLPVQNEYSVSLHLLDEAGHRYGQHDKLHPAGYPVPRWQANQYARDEHALAIWPGTPPGTYHLILFVHEVEGGRRLSVLNEGGLPLANQFELGKVTITLPRYFPSPDEVEMGVRLPAELAPEVRLLGFDLPLTQAEVGHTLPLTLYWHTPDTPRADYTARLRLTSETAGAVTVMPLPATANNRIPDTSWQPGQIGRDPRSFLIPPRQADSDRPLAAGTYTLYLDLMSPQQSTPERTLDLTEIEVTVPPRASDCPPLDRQLNVPLDGWVTLQGYRLNAHELTSGQSLTLTLCWRADGTTGTSYTTFTQLLGPDGRVYAQQDQIPHMGARPTTGWYDEAITDTVTLTLAAEAPAGTYRLITGMYDNQTGERLPVPGRAEDYVALPTPIEVKTAE